MFRFPDDGGNGVPQRRTRPDFLRSCDRPGNCDRARILRRLRIRISCRTRDVETRQKYFQTSFREKLKPCCEPSGNVRLTAPAPRASSISLTRCLRELERRIFLFSKSLILRSSSSSS